MSKRLQPVDQMVPGANLAAYVQAVSSIPVLTAEREKALAEDLFFNDNLQAAEMHEFILRNWRIVKVATTKAQRKLFFNLRSAKKSLGWLSHEEAQAVAHDLGVDIAEVQRMEGRLSSRDVGYEQPRDADDDDGWQAPQFYLEDAGADPATLVESSDWQETSEGHLHAALADLDERSRDILARRWLTEDKATLHELAAEYSVSAERIRQLEQGALKKLRTAMAA